MTISFLIIGLVAVVAAIANIVAEYSRVLMMMQQNSYRPERYMRWLRSSGDSTSYPRLVGMTIRGVEVYDVDQMEEYVRTHPVDVAILTLPRSQAVKVANSLAKWGVKGMWNFSHVDLQVPDDVLVENVHLTDSLMTLLYKINEMYNEDNALHHLVNGLPVKPMSDNGEDE